MRVCVLWTIDSYTLVDFALRKSIFLFILMFMLETYWASLGPPGIMHEKPWIFFLKLLWSSVSFQNTWTSECIKKFDFLSAKSTNFRTLFFTVQRNKFTQQFFLLALFNQRRSDLCSQGSLFHCFDWARKKFQRGLQRDSKKWWENTKNSLLSLNLKISTCFLPIQRKTRSSFFQHRAGRKPKLVILAFFQILKKYAYEITKITFEIN